MTVPYIKNQGLLPPDEILERLLHRVVDFQGLYDIGYLTRLPIGGGEIPIDH